MGRMMVAVWVGVVITGTAAGVRAQAVIPVPNWAGCSAQIERGAVAIRCADSEPDHNGRDLACRPLLHASIVPGDELEVIHGCSEGDNVPNALVMTSGARVLWAFAGGWYEGLGPDAIDLVATGDSGGCELLVRSAQPEEGDALRVFVWAEGRMHEAVYVSIGGGTDEPERQRRASFVLAGEPAIEVTRVRGGGPARERLRWDAATRRFERAAR